MRTDRSRGPGRLNCFHSPGGCHRLRLDHDPFRRRSPGTVPQRTKFTSRSCEMQCVRSRDQEVADSPYRMVVSPAKAHGETSRAYGEALSVAVATLENIFFVQVSASGCISRRLKADGSCGRKGVGELVLRAVIR